MRGGSARYCHPPLLPVLMRSPFCLMQYCWVHPEKEAAIQCILCLRCKVRQREPAAAPRSPAAGRHDGRADKQWSN